MSYSSANLLSEEMFWNSSKKKNIIDYIKAYINSRYTTVDLKITIPTSVYLRTRQLCMHVEDYTGISFGLDNFVIVMYYDFINNIVYKKDILSVYKMIKYKDTNTVKISNGSEVWECSLRKQTITNLLITMDKKEVIKGELLLAEIHELYGDVLNFEDTLSIIWCSFIENYIKNGSETTLKIMKILLKENLYK